MLHHFIPSSIKRFTKILLARIKEEETFEQSAALTYHTLFSLLPTVVLVLLVISMISGARGASGSTIAESVQGFLVRQLALDQVHMTGSNGESLDLVKFLTERIESARQIVQSPATGLIAFGTLLWGALSLMLVIERAFNQIYHAPQHRPWSRRITLYWSVLTLGPLAVAASLWLSTRLDSAASSFSAAIVVLKILQFFSAFLWSWVLVLLAYKLIPQAHVKWSSAIVGSFVGAVLWEAGKALFAVYVAKFVGYGKWYGNIGLVPLFMFWIYYTWQFILIGLQVAYVHQNYRLLARSLAYRNNSETPFADVRWVLPLGVMLFRQFQQGKPLIAAEAAEVLNLPPNVGEELLRSLNKAGLIHSVDCDEGEAYTLARPPENITAEDLLEAARATCAAPADMNMMTHDSSEFMKPALSQYQSAVMEWSTKTSLPKLAESQK